MSARKVTKSRKPKPWGEAHRREALRRMYEIAAEFTTEESMGHAMGLTEAAWQVAQEESTWRSDLGSLLTSARVDREVARIRALAEGRLVRDRGWRVGDEWYADDEKALARRQAYPGRPLLRVIRIRRAP